MSSNISSNSEVFASELPEIYEDMLLEVDVFIMITSLKRVKMNGKSVTQFCR